MIYSCSFPLANLLSFILRFRLQLVRNKIGLMYQEGANWLTSHEPASFGEVFLGWKPLCLNSPWKTGYVIVKLRVEVETRHFLKYFRAFRVFFFFVELLFDSQFECFENGYGHRTPFIVLFCWWPTLCGMNQKRVESWNWETVSDISCLVKDHSSNG